MGSQESKVLEQSITQEKEVKDTFSSDSTPSTPIPLDPRSPSVNIARTPLELILNPKLNEEKVEDDSEEVPDVVNVVLGIDPRSPTVEFNRTPIIVGAVTKEKPARLKNKNLDNVLKTEIQTTPVTTTRKNSNIIPPKLLETSPVTVVQNYNNKRKSFVGLLETNIDYTETDLDTVCQTIEDTNKTLPIELDEDLPCDNLKQQMDALSLENNEKITIIEKDPEEKVANVTAQVKDFDKKLTNLIYQDDSDDETKTILRLAKKENNRTPLSVRNGNEDGKKSQSRLKVSDKPRKPEISRIPVLNKNNLSKKMRVQCENTPPKFEDNKCRPKVTHWDADKTLII